MATTGVDGRAAPNLLGCPAGSRVRIRLYNAAGTLVDWPFTVWLE